MAGPKFVAAICAHAVLEALSLDDLEPGADDQVFEAIAGTVDQLPGLPPKPAKVGAGKHARGPASLGMRLLMRH